MGHAGLLGEGLHKITLVVPGEKATGKYQFENMVEEHAQTSTLEGHPS